MDNRYDLTHNLENIVYNELIYMGYKIYVFNNQGREIDFLAQKGNKKYYIQVAYSIADEKHMIESFLLLLISIIYLRRLLLQMMILIIQQVL